MRLLVALGLIAGLFAGSAADAAACHQVLDPTGDDTMWLFGTSDPYPQQDPPEAGGRIDWERMAFAADGDTLEITIEVADLEAVRTQQSTGAEYHMLFETPLAEVLISMLEDGGEWTFKSETGHVPEATVDTEADRVVLAIDGVVPTDGRARVIDEIRAYAREGIPSPVWLHVPPFYFNPLLYGFSYDSIPDDIDGGARGTVDLDAIC